MLCQYERLNYEQKSAVDNIVNVIMKIKDVNSKAFKNCYFVDGPGGSGKTFIYNTLWNLLSWEQEKSVYNGFYGNTSYFASERKNSS